AAETRAAQEVAARIAAEEAAARKAAEARAAQEAAARQAAEARAAQEVAARRAAEEEKEQEAAKAAAAMETGAEALTGRDAESKAEQENAVQETVEKSAEVPETPPAPSDEENDNKGTMKKAAIGVLILLLLIGAYFMFGKKKEAPPAPEPAKVETKAETKTETKTETDKAADPAAKEAKLKEYAEAMKAVNEQKKQDATANEKIVFLVENVQRREKELLITGHFYNGKKNRTITSVKMMELDIVLRDMDKELLNEKNVKCAQPLVGISIEPLQDSPVLTVNLPDKAPDGEFNNFMVTAHDVHWEGVGN
ncbi:MAG: hypothetical protein IKM73_04590, partial [Acidaminococcaceae bacterium]|nr:hypothetical protein [Acidaminococcaceae bacterium]